MNDFRTSGYSLAESLVAFQRYIKKIFTHFFSLFTNSCFACSFFKSIASTKCKYSCVAVWNWCSGRGSSCVAVSVKESSFKWTGVIPGKSWGSCTRWLPVGESPACPVYITSSAWSSCTTWSETGGATTAPGSETGAGT